MNHQHNGGGFGQPSLEKLSLNDQSHQGLVPMSGLYNAMDPWRRKYQVR